MKITKSVAFLLGLVSIILLAGLLAFVSPESLGPQMGAFLTALVTLVTGFLGWNVADNFQRSRNFVPELHKEEGS